MNSRPSPPTARRRCEPGHEAGSRRSGAGRAEAADSREVGRRGQPGMVEAQFGGARGAHRGGLAGSVAGRRRGLTARSDAAMTVPGGTAVAAWLTRAGAGLRIPTGQHDPGRPGQRGGLAAARVRSRRPRVGVNAGRPALAGAASRRRDHLALEPDARPPGRRAGPARPPPAAPLPRAKGSRPEGSPGGRGPAEGSRAEGPGGGVPGGGSGRRVPGGSRGSCGAGRRVHGGADAGGQPGRVGTRRRVLPAARETKADR